MTIVNLSLWCILFAAWTPYTLAMGPTDSVSSEVRTILAATLPLMGLLAVVRLRRHRPVLG